MNEKTLSGRTAIITGASQGLGREISKRIVAAGANVMLCARNYGLLEETEQELNSLLVENQKIFIKKCDVSIQNEVEDLVSDTFVKFGGCQILVNNAGIYGPKGTVENQDWDDWKKAIEINVYGPVLMCRALIPHLKKQKYGKICLLYTSPSPRD